MAEGSDLPGANRLLSTLDPSVLAELAPSLEPVTLNFKQTLYEVGKPMD